MLLIMNTQTLDTIALSPTLTSPGPGLRPQISRREDKAARVPPGTEPVGLERRHGQRCRLWRDRQAERANDRHQDHAHLKGGHVAAWAATGTYPEGCKAATPLSIYVGVVV